MKAKNRLSGVKSIVLLPSILILILVSINCLSFSAFAEWEAKDGKTYYLDESGKKVTGWQTIDDKKYYFASDGTMRTGWLKMKSGKSYYLRSDGSMITGWAKIKGEKYYFDKNGVMATGLKKVSSDTYFLTDSGMLKGWLKYYGVYYYFDNDGKMIKNKTSKINNVKYKFNADGSLELDSNQEKPVAKYTVKGEEPDLTVLVYPDTNLDSTLVGMIVMNNGSKKLKIEQYGYDGIDILYLIKDNGDLLDYQIIKADSQDTVFFIKPEVDWYSKRNNFYFHIVYDNTSYIVVANKEYGTTWKETNEKPD